jgi:hypothetical protein
LKPGWAHGESVSHAAFFSTAAGARVACAAAPIHPSFHARRLSVFPTSASDDISLTGIVARIIADKFSETLGQQVIVDQRPGAGGTVAAKQLARIVSEAAGEPDQGI